MSRVPTIALFYYYYFQWPILMASSIHIFSRPRKAVRLPFRRVSRLFSSISSTSRPLDRRRISYLTDVEGDRDYLDRFVKISKVLDWENGVKTNASDSYSFPYSQRLVFQKPDSDMLVFGGDVCDQGGSDLWVMRQLLDLKRRHPSQLHIVMGNRDINKMRIPQELGNVGDKEAPPHSGVYWLRGSNKTGDPSLGTFLSNHPVERLQWMLANTMGSPKAFAHRKNELARERGVADDAVSDWDVVESYRRSCHPSGEMGQYLSNAKLAVKIGDALFVHGALPITDDALACATKLEDISKFWSEAKYLRSFAMPWLDHREETSDVNDINSWLACLNEFSRQRVENWKKNCKEEPYWSSVGGYKVDPTAFSPLIQYGMGWLPDKSRNPTCVYSSWNTNGMPERFLDQQPASQPNSNHTSFQRLTSEFFRLAEISVLCCGHQPQGDMPNPIRVQDVDRKGCGDRGNKFIVCGDTSYSGDVQWFGDDEGRNVDGRAGGLSGRGPRAVSEIVLEQQSGNPRVATRVFSHGVLSDGTRYETLPYTDTPTSVGTQARGEHIPIPVDSPHKGPWWNRALLSDGSRVLSAGKGFDQWNLFLRRTK